MQAVVAVYGLLSLGLVSLAFLAGATFVNALLVTVSTEQHPGWKGGVGALFPLGEH
jgi:hypothetical protein